MEYKLHESQPLSLLMVIYDDDVQHPQIVPRTWEFIFQFFQISIRLFTQKYLLSTYYVLGIQVGPRDLTLSKTVMISRFRGAYILTGMEGSYTEVNK